AFLEQQRRDQEPREREEELHAEEGTAGITGVVERHHGRHQQAAYPVQRGDLAEPPHSARVEPRAQLYAVGRRRNRVPPGAQAHRPLKKVANTAFGAQAGARASLARGRAWAWAPAGRACPAPADLARKPFRKGRSTM